MSKDYHRHFDGTVHVLDKPVKLKFGKVGRHLAPGFIVTSIRDDIGFLLKENGGERFRITHSNFFIDALEKRRLEAEVNEIIKIHGIRKAA